jgi:D-sedoheptulose 7-phosphate isomerase
VRCLTDNIPLYTAWANDADREDVFANQMRHLLTAEDVVIAISVHGGSGFSTDLVKGARYAREVGAKTIALVGFDGGLLHRECTCSILVPVESTPQTEAIHLVIEHLLMQLIKDDLAGHAS